MYFVLLFASLLSVFLLFNPVSSHENVDGKIDGLPIPEKCKTMMKQGVAAGRDYYEKDVKFICEEKKCKISAKDSMKNTFPPIRDYILEEIDWFKQQNHKVPFDVKKTMNDIAKKCFESDTKFMAIDDVCVCNKDPPCIDKEKTKKCVGDHVSQHVISIMGWLPKGCELAIQRDMIKRVSNYIHKRSMEVPNDPMCRH